MKCYECFREYWEGNVCPHCGYQSEYSDTEVRCLEKSTFICDGRYEIGRVIGAGGFGVTYAAWDTMLQMRVAIKEYLPGEFSTRAPGNISVSIYGGEKEEQYKDGLAKFYEESQRLAQFQEVQGIVQVFDVFMENETAYIVMEYLEGETLAERLKREEKIPYQEAVKIMLPILQALETVHKEGILHRDIAPNNIFLCKNGEIKLLDFGAARSATGTHSKSLTVLYKEGYTAEEQYRSRGDQGSWTDVYACAATLYKMLTGKIPQGAMERRRKDMLKAPSKCGAKVSVNVDRAIMNALNVEIENRTQTAGQLMEELLTPKGIKDRFKKVKNKKRDRVPLWIWVISAVTVICVTVFLFMLIIGKIQFIEAYKTLVLDDEKARVPNLINLDVNEAQKKAELSGLTILIKDKEFSMEIPENCILQQELKKGTIVDKGTQLIVVVSAGVNSMSIEEMEEKGVVLFEIPDLQYQDRDEVLGMLLDAGLNVKIDYELTGIVEGGKVIKQSVAVGDKLVKGQEIVLTVEDFIVDFSNASFIESVIRDVIGKESEDIWASEMSNIESIYLWYSDYLDYEESPINESIAPLANCLNLKELFLADSIVLEDGQISDDNLHYYSDLYVLKNLVHLEDIRLDNLYVENLNWLNNMTNLSWLMMCGSKIDNISLDTKFDKLSYIDLSNTFIENISNDSIFYNVSLFTVSGDTMLKIDNFHKLEELFQLWVNGANEDDEMYINKVKGMSNIYTMQIDGRDIIDKKNNVFVD